MKKVNWADHLMNFMAVILGVSLAFIISSNSEEKKLLHETSLNVQAILDEVSSDIETYEDYQIPDNREKLDQMTSALERISMGTIDDSTMLYLNAFFDVNNYSPSNVTLNSLISSGKLDLIDDFELKSELLGYQNLSKELIRQGDFQVEYLMDKVMPWFLENPLVLIEGSKSLQSVDDLNMARLVVILSFYTSFVDGKIEKYELALSRAKDIRSMLKSYQGKE